MIAATIRRFSGPQELEIVELPTPDPGHEQVRIRVAASTVNPIDVATRNGALTDAGLIAPAPVLGVGWDVAGEVDAVGPDVARFEIGSRVVGLRDLLFAYPGANAEYVVPDEHAVAPAPASCSLTEAATLPLNGLTADRTLELAGLRAGQTLLVTGAAGGVGGFVLELGALRGLRTVAVAGPDDEALVRGLGATEFVARTEALGAVVRQLVPGGVDAVINAAVLGITAHDALRGGGTFVALVAPFAPPSIPGTRVLVQEVLGEGARLGELVALVDAGRLSMRVAHTFALSEVASAHERFAAGGLRGRLVPVP